MKMNMKMKMIGTLFALCAAALCAQASPVLQENFDYPDGVLTSVSSGNWTAFSGSGNFPIQATGGIITFTNVGGGTSGEDLKRDFNAPVTSGALYMKAVVSLTNAPGNAAGDYFLAFYSTNTSSGGYITRIFSSTIAAGGWSFGMTNSPGSNPTDWPAALATNTWYEIIVKLNVDDRTAAFGVFPNGYNPSSDSELTVMSPASTATAPVTSIAIRQGANTPFAGAFDSIIVGTTLSDIVGGPVGPSITLQPQDTNSFVGSTVYFSTLATGDAPITYQWYYNTNTLLNDETNTTLVLPNISLGSAGTYSAVASNAIDTATTRYAVLTVTTAPVPPTITNQPANVTVNVGDTAIFTVGVDGTPTLRFQWKSVIGGVTNNVGTDDSSLTLANASADMAGSYFVTITNLYGKTNSDLATLVVNPPQALTIAQFRAKVNGSFAPTNTTTSYTLTGIVTTWMNMTTSTTDTEFYMQDDTGGIAVFWLGAAPSTNLPPAGALVQVTGPMDAFRGLLEIKPLANNPLHSVTILSTNNPLPKAQPLPFDPNVTGYPSITKNAAMNSLESMYFVASNVTLNSSTPNFVSGANDTITNNTHVVGTVANSVVTVNFTNENGQAFILFVNGATDIPNQPKYAGPVTIYGILGYFDGTGAGYEFTPSRYADIIAYSRFTNILSHVSRKGDLLTNSFTENVVRPGEVLDLYVEMGDPAGGSVTLLPNTSGLPGSASWSSIVNGTTATAHFHFAPTSGDAGVNYIIPLGISTPSGTSTNNWYVYVPTADEQQIYITEFLANATSNTNNTYFNPLHRNTDTLNPAGVDKYVEIVNRSSTTFDLYGWSLTDASVLRHTFLLGESFGETLPANNAIVIYGGEGSSVPNLPAGVVSYAANSNPTNGLALPTQGQAIIALRNPGYFNDGHGIKPGYIVDRVVYNGTTDLRAGSLSRFPHITNSFVPQVWINVRTNSSTAGLQYDGAPWSAPTQTPAGVSNIVITAGNPVTLSFTTKTNAGTTIWSAGVLTDPFRVLGGTHYTNPAAQFTITNPPASMQFYFITTQTNYIAP